MRRLVVWLLIATFLVAGSAACKRIRPAPVGAPTCAGTPVEAPIRAAFAGTGDEEWALRKAWSESRCDPCSFYDRQSNCGAQPRTAKGVMQLLNHDDLITAACPGRSPLPWADPACNAKAARFLYDGSGRAPWGG